MRTRPKSLTTLALFLSAIALGFPLQVMWVHNHLPWHLPEIISKLTPLNAWIICMSLVCTHLALRASRLLLLTLPTLSAMVLYNNWIVGSMGLNATATSCALATLGFLGVLFNLRSHEAMQVILNPSKRWWRTPFRWQIKVPVRLKVFTKEAFEFDSLTFDISEGGAFIPTPLKDEAPELPVGTQCYVALKLGGLNIVHCRGEVVRKTVANGKYPAGIGVRFLGMTLGERAHFLGRVRMAAERRNVELFS